MDNLIFVLNLTDLICQNFTCQNLLFLAVRMLCKSNMELRFQKIKIGNI